MPLYEYQCLDCERVREVLCGSYALKPQTILCDHCRADMIPLVSAPGLVDIKGYSSKNGFTKSRTIQGPRFGGVRTEVTGNFEAFAEGIE